MGLKLNREKDKNFLLIVIYRLFKLKILSNKVRLKLFLNLEWIFDRLAHEESYKIYNVEEHPVRLSSMEFLKKHIKSTDKVFDLGCNSGDLSNLIADISYEVIGIDYNEKLIKLAKIKYSRNNLSFHFDEAYNFLKKNNNKFDVLILSHILEHLDNPKEFLNEFKIFFNYIFIDLPDYESSFSNKFRLKVGSKLNYTDIDHVSEFDRLELIEILTFCGLEVLDVEYKFGFQKYWCKVK
ncbi:MAG: methyltransferase domain-containing protein [Flavobacteriia bacterium]|nr:methyltransferase domain-containing protein [Flavobacteriia bacterium]